MGRQQAHNTRRGTHTTAPSQESVHGPVQEAHEEQAQRQAVCDEQHARVPAKAGRTGRAGSIGTRQAAVCVCVWLPPGAGTGV
jgi:hypothetical protein